MNRILTFHLHESSGSRMAPSAYYMEAEYQKVAVRVYAERAPIRNATFDIFDDGVSIFSNRTNPTYNIYGVETTGVAVTEAFLPANQSSEDIAEDFNASVIDEGSWVYCNMVDAGGGSNFTVQLELHQVSEDEEGEG